MRKPHREVHSSTHRLARIKPIVAPFIQRLLGPDAPDVEILQPEEKVSVRPPTVLTGMLDLVTSTDEHSQLSFHIAATTRTQVVHAPVIRWTFRGAIVSRNGFATWRHRERYSGYKAGDFFFSQVEPVQYLRYCNNYVISRYFGHWLTDAIPSALIDSETGHLWMPSKPKWVHAIEYQNALELRPSTEPLIFAEQLICYQDYGQGSHKQARYATIRDRLQARFGFGGANYCVYIRRGQTGEPRWIRDEEKLVEALSERDWKIIDIATASVPEIQSALCRARVVVSIEGSHLNHAQLSMMPRSVLVALVPHDRFTTNFIGRCRAHGGSPGLIVLKGSRADGYEVNLNEILRTVDLAMQQADI